MIRVRFWFAVCYILGMLVVFAWWRSNIAVGLLNGYIEVCGAIAAGLGEIIARICGFNPTLGGELLIEKISGGRILAIGFIAVLWYLLLGSIWNYCKVHFFHRPKHSYWPLLGVLICMFVVLAVLGILWLIMPETMKAWYAMHKDWLAMIFRKQGWHQAETLLLNLFSLQNLVVYLEGVLIYVFLTQLIRFILWLFKKFFSGVFWAWNSAFGGR